MRLVGQGALTLPASILLTAALANAGTPLQPPIIDYNVSGVTAYDSTTDVLSISATPISYESAGDSGIFFSGALTLNVEVDDSGSLVGGVPGDDFVLTGDVDTNGDFVVDFSGLLLVGEISVFRFENGPPGGEDVFEFDGEIASGLLAGQFPTGFFGVRNRSGESTFDGLFTGNFGGLATGQVGGVEAIIPEPASLGLAGLGVAVFSLSWRKSACL